MADYTSLAKVREFVGKAAGDTDDDARISAIIPRVTALFNAWTHRRFDPFTVSNLKTQASQPRMSKLFLYDDSTDPPNGYLVPIRTITLLKEGGTTLTANTDFFVNKREGSLEKDVNKIWVHTPAAPYWTTVLREIEVSGTFGFAAVPPDIEQAATESVAVLALEKVKTFTTNEGVEQTVVLTSLPEYVNDLLESYRIRPL